MNLFYLLFQDSRPLGAIMISDCQVLSGTGNAQVGDTVDSRMTFRLKLSSSACGHQMVVCLATESLSDLDQWVDAIRLSSMAPETVSA